MSDTLRVILGISVELIKQVRKKIYTEDLKMCLVFSVNGKTNVCVPFHSRLLQQSVL